ncbi:MBL fold metallo-hydrolase [Pantoea rodasii]|uniref:MBL fold metallo-hydrolase n=1 Tax=Pantoea rodasii TaxID=1076549 RepID=A0A2M9W8Z0_9GAMM|nr:MBL fold metallo-hydrolase [Pantoea rodasii]ORM63587.1 MBL fold metallo-hydrolase [Pantoea rodasii]PJZ04007.1 MBL fold metallo-hydrolase [Pantoea rodasii]
MTIRVGDCLIEKIVEQSATFPYGTLFKAHRAEMSDAVAAQPAEISIHSWVVRTAEHTILIDTATGNGRDRDNKPLFHQLNTPYAERLAQAGVDPAAVTLVLMTHIHTDHVGWNTHFVDGQWQPMFPNARYVCSALELQRCQNDAANEALYRDSILPLMVSGQLETVNPKDSPLYAGVLRYLSTPGHSSDHASIVLESQGECAIFAGDVMHHPIQFQHPLWNSLFCEDLPLAIASRQRVIDWCRQHQAIWFSSHFHHSSCGRVARDGQWIPLEE